jgi:hypothetical protein
MRDDYFADAKSFKPERWLGPDAGELDKKLGKFLERSPGMSRNKVRLPLSFSFETNGPDSNSEISALHTRSCSKASTTCFVPSSFRSTRLLQTIWSSMIVIAWRFLDIRESRSEVPQIRYPGEVPCSAGKRFDSLTSTFTFAHVT